MPALNNSLALYIHWPFCLSKCPYCDFNSHVRDHIDETAWLNTLMSELDHYRALSGPRNMTSVFFGGGTPSLMGAGTVEKILHKISENWGLDRHVEITLEANPTSVEASKFKDFSKAGINRLSLGIQALNDHDLKALGREHNAKEALKAIALSQKYFERSSFDLIYARMDQTMLAWEKELTEALQMSVGHLSLYQLTIERGTAFYHAHNKGRIILPNEDLSADMYELTQMICTQHGLPAYEVSNHAALGNESRHNLSYWTYRDYIGVGPGAHGRLTYGGNLHALSQYKSPEKWMEYGMTSGHGTEYDECLNDQMKAEEMIMMGLRLVRGIDLHDFHNKLGAKIEKYINTAYLQRLFELGYMEMDDHHLRATALGMPLLNSLLGGLLK